METGGGKKKACPKNLQMKREGFSLNAIKFFHFNDFPADSFGSLVARSRNCCPQDGATGGGRELVGERGSRGEMRSERGWQTFYIW